MSGWKRELTREGIEPNPGPMTWKEMCDQLEMRMGDDWPTAKEELESIKPKLPTKYPTAEVLLNNVEKLNLDATLVDLIKDLVSKSGI